MSNTPTELTLFYAWQSDSPASTNRNAIRVELTNAAAEIEANRPGIVLKIDEATRDMLGSDNVPDSIRTKIEAADIFIGDVTTVNPPPDKPDDKVRACPNPNVTFEIGYAAAHLGWKRLILLINVATAKYEDLPFDFDRQRVSRFRVKAASDADGKGKLKTLLVDAITAIVDNNPPRPAELKAASPAEIRRRRDIENATWALSKIKIPLLQDHIQALPHMVNKDVFHFYYGYCGVIQSGLFHINDPKLDSAFRGLADAWQRALAPGENYHQNSAGHSIFSNPGDMPLSEEQQKDWDTITQARDDMLNHLNKLLEIIRADYVEIDPKETNRRAHNDWQQEEAK